MMCNVNRITIAEASDKYSFDTHMFHCVKFIVWKHELEIGVVVI